MMMMMMIRWYCDGMNWIYTNKHDVFVSKLLGPAPEILSPIFSSGTHLTPTPAPAQAQRHISF